MCILPRVPFNCFTYSRDCICETIQSMRDNKNTVSHLKTENNLLLFLELFPYAVCSLCEIDFFHQPVAAYYIWCRISYRYKRCLRKLAVCRICIIICKTLLIPLPGIGGIHFARWLPSNKVFCHVSEQAISSALIWAGTLHILCNNTGIWTGDIHLFRRVICLVQTVCLVISNSF